MSVAERPRQLNLYRLHRGERVVEARTLACERFVPLIDLVRQEDGLRLAVRSEGDRLGCGTFAAEPREDPGKPLSYLRQGMDLKRS
jgi:hypothetical protein